MRTYPLCLKYDLLREGRDGDLRISTSALWSLVGERRYQKCRKLFVYEGQFPRPAEVEMFLRKHFDR